MVGAVDVGIEFTEESASSRSSSIEAGKGTGDCGAGEGSLCEFVSKSKRTVKDVKLGFWK
jgi:hypothetical protein